MNQTTRHGVRSRGLFLASLMVSAVIGAPMAHAQPIYLHSPGEEKAANELKEGLDAAKKAHLEAIDKHKAYLEDAIKRERQLVAERELAFRDMGITAAMDAKGRDEADGRAVLRSEIAARLETLTGISADKADTAFEYLEDNAEDAAGIRTRLLSDRARLKRQISLFESAGGEGKYCDDKGAGMASAPVQPGTNPGVFNSIRISCDRISGELSALKGLYADAPPGVRPLLGDASAVAALPASSPVRAALEDLSAAENLLNAQQAVAKAVEKRLKELKEYHRCELARAKAPGQEARVMAAAQSLQDFIGWASNWQSGEVSELDDAPQARTAEGTACAPAAVPKGGILALAKQDRAKVADWLKELDHVAPLRALLAGAQEAAQQFKSGELGEIVSALADPTRRDGQRDEAAAAASLLRLYGYIGRLDAYRSGKLPNVSAVMVELAAAEMRKATARIEVARFEKVASLSSSRFTAFVQEAQALQRAHHELTGPHPGFEHAALAYSDAWTVGRIPAAVLYYDMINTSYIAWVDRERAVVEAAYGALAPVASELQIYGASGVKASEIAGYLQALGLGAIAW